MNKKIKHIIFAFLLCIPIQIFSQEKADNKFSSYPGRQNLLDKIVETDNDPIFENATWSIIVNEAKSGKNIAKFNENKSLIPASLMKAITTGVGYWQLGANFTFDTKFEYSGEITQDSILNGNLYIVGGADPTLCCFLWKNTNPDTLFYKWTKLLKEKGISKITGKIIADISMFDDLTIPGTWQWSDIGNYYGASSTPLMFNENLINIWFSSSDSIGVKAQIDSIYPKMPWITLVNYVQSAANNTGDNVCVYSQPNGTNILLKGTIPAGKSAFKVKAANTKPDYTLLWNFNNYLNENGIKTSNYFSEVTFRDIPDTNVKRKLLFVNKSPSYNAIASHTNKYSHNTFAEIILKTLGYRRSGVGSFYSGTKAIDFALANKGISTKGFINVDGSGLSRNNLVTTSMICNYLSAMTKSYAFNSFYLSLSEAGSSGTLSWMMKGTSAAKNLRAKSGSLEQIKSYGGYVKCTNGNLLCFSIIVNNYSCSSLLINKKIEELMVAISNL